MGFAFTSHKNIYFAFSGLLLIGAVAAIAVFGLQLGIEFTGGSVLEVRYADERPRPETVTTQLRDIESGGQVIAQPTGERGMLIRMQGTGEELRTAALTALRQEGNGTGTGAVATSTDAKAGTTTLQQLRFESIGPVIGQELRNKAVWLIVLSLAAIVSYIAIAFRTIRWPRKSYEYGLITLLTLFHDLLIVVGVLAVLGHIISVPITIPILVALLTVAGYSVNDTVVVFDRVRENLADMKAKTFPQMVDASLSQTVVRSLNTSLTTLLVLAAIFLFGGDSLAYFALVLIVGIAVGTYSSMFVAAPLLVALPKLGRG